MYALRRYLWRIPGADVTVVMVNNGNVIVNVKEARVAISKEMANKIMIR